MKMKKCALGLVAMLAGVTALSACDLVTANDNGSIFTYTDALGNRVSYSANDLLANYQDTPSSLSTEFDKVYEVLVRHYYDSLKSPSTKLADLKALADRDVIKDKQTAKNNASSTSSYEAEFEKILTSHSVKNVSELYEYHLYEEEKTDFQNAIYQTWGTNDSAINGLEAMKDGYYTKDGQQVSIMQASTDANNYWGIGNSGWLLDQMPYHYRHILVKLASGKTGEFTQDKIGESTDGKGGEATKLSRLIFALAGANYASDVDSANKRTTTIESLPIRQSFGYLASQYSEDNSGSPASSTHQGETSIVTKVMSSDFVPEFKLGSYAYETLFNQRETSTDFGKANAYRIAPGLKKDAGTYVGTSAITTNMIDSNQTLEDGTTVYHEIEKTGLGQIPFGAAVALADMADTVKDVNGNTVNEGNEVFYPRNVIFNKYFNKHNICVITPNAIMSNSTIDSTKIGADLTTVADQVAGNKVTKQFYKGAYSSLFGSLPGFKVDTTNVVSVTDDNNKAENVLTNSEGQIVLAVRVSSSGYQGIHFIVVERSGLSKFGLHTDSSGKVVENANEAEATANNVATSSQYYTTYLPDSTSYPVNKDNVQTYVDYNKPTSEDLTTRSGNIATAIKGYNSALSTYQFEMLVNNGSITFNDKTLGSKMMSFSTIKRQAAVDSAFTTWSDNWKSYAETLAAQEAARAIGKDTGLGTLLCETTATEYASTTKTTDLWEKGGACYYGTK
jgi:hypothetical protein